MLGSITPLGERARNAKWSVTIGFYILGSALAGSGAGALFAVAGIPFSSSLGVHADVVALVILGAVVIIGLALDARLFGLQLPTVKRQVSQEWLTTYRGWVYGFGFGFQLGIGFITIVTTSTVYTVFVAAFLTASPVHGALIGGLFGVARASTVFSVVNVRSFQQFDAIEPALDRWEGPVRRLSFGSQLLVAGLLLSATAFLGG